MGFIQRIKMDKDKEKFNLFLYSPDGIQTLSYLGVTDIKHYANGIVTAVDKDGSKITLRVQGGNLVTQSIP
jgi:hypothetical protein